ncbi:MAG: nucleotidyltransferase domain-containing protein [Candidatus Thorarchaeota archaeon]
MKSTMIPKGLQELGILSLLNELEYNSKSVYLTGSWARGTNTSLSDIDLDILACEDIPKEIILGTITPYQSNKIVIDAKIFTPIEFTQLQKGPSHFFFWTRFQDGLHISGDSLSLKHDYEQTRRFIEVSMDRMNEAISLVHSGRYLATVLFLMYESLCGSYFLESYLLNGKRIQYIKEEYLRNHCGNLFSLCRQNYYTHVRAQFQDSLDWPIRIRFRSDLKMKKDAFQTLKDVIYQVDNHVMNVYNSALRKIDSIV